MTVGHCGEAVDAVETVGEEIDGRFGIEEQVSHVDSSDCRHALNAWSFVFQQCIRPVGCLLELVRIHFFVMIDKGERHDANAAVVENQINGGGKLWLAVS